MLGVGTELGKLRLLKGRCRVSLSLEGVDAGRVPRMGSWCVDEEGAAVGQGGPGLRLRPYENRDQAVVLELIGADRLPGQPAVEAHLLVMALVGTAPGVEKRAWWAELDRPQTVVAVDAAGRTAGVVSFAVRPGDGAGVVLWLHTREDPAVAELLLDHTLEQMGPGRCVYGFACCPAWASGVDGLPARRRQATRQVLLDTGFTDSGEQSYWHRAIGAPGPPAYPLAQLSPRRDAPGWRLELTDTDGTPVAEAFADVPQETLGVLRWIAVEPAWGGAAGWAADYWSRA